MADIKLGPQSPTADTGTDPKAVVTLDPSLKPGIYAFTLVVTDDAGLVSAPATINVQVRELPVAHLTAVPTVVALGQPITLVGDGSTSTGKLVKFTWSFGGVVG